MMIAFATGIAAIACQGCVSSDHSSGTSYSTPTPPSLGLMLAMPGHLGNGAMNSPSATGLMPGLQAELANTDPAAEAVELYRAPGDILTVATAPSQAPGFSVAGAGFDNLQLGQTNLAWGSSPVLAAVAADVALNRHGRPVEASRDISLGLAIAAPSDRTGLGFDVSVMPRYALRNEGDLSTQRFGGEVRLGQGLDLIGRSGGPEGWYFFVGADGEALVWDNSRAMPSLGDLFDMQLTDQVTVGDLQAGFSIQQGPGQLSFSYIRREVKFDDRNRTLKDSEDFAGITFTMRR